MTTAQIEKRVTAIEQELANLKAQIESSPPRSNNWVQAIAGTFANDPIFDQAMALGREWRVAQRPKARTSKSPRRKAGK